ncbi:MAG: hypothetical protein CL943_01220 [Candidatus Diapherotrites archaeon]|uniref:Uncharacterized protein n=1 Tax=Candidatus Iainarchaeum sp. TaxID=3101447 RepID=A0A2D6M0G1_9ARCH|nr:hypothetical protein [Candidatus Diapherotrites archaeon]|tara:strand:- start:205 stop:1884 length:1680 start_codon:yes stop_codon:yes gene_type:complete
MTKRILFLLTALALFAASALAQELTYSGDVQIKLNQNNFQSEEELAAEITVFNNEEFPIADAYVVVEIAKGGEFSYPSQFASSDNVFFEEKVSGINLAPNSSKKIEFTYELPDNISPGSYRLDVYFKNVRTGIIGYAHIFTNPESAYFSVLGAGSFPSARIVRDETVFNDVLGPVGFPVEADESITGKVFVANDSDSALSDLKLVVSVCEWDDTACEEFVETKEVAVGPLVAGQEKEIAVGLQPLGKTSAYAVRLELLQGNQLLSLYRNRIIVVGPGKRIHKVYLNNFYFKRGETVEINALVGPSPDHFNNPVLAGSSLVLSVKDVESGNSLFSETIGLEGNGKFVKKSASFTAESELKKIEVCGKVVKGTVQYDEYCFEVDAELFAETQEATIATNWKYDGDTFKLSLEFCALTPSKFVQPIKMNYYLQQNGQTIEKGDIEAEGCAEEEVVVSIGKYELIVNNLETKKQSAETIDIVTYLQSCENVNCDDGNACTQDNCTTGKCSQEVLPDGSACENGQCQSGECVESRLPLEYLVVGIVGLAIIFFGYTYLKGRKEE